MSEAPSREPTAAFLEIFNEFVILQSCGIDKLDADTMMAHTLKCICALIRHEETSNTRNTEKSLIFWTAVKMMNGPGDRSLVANIGLNCSSHTTFKGKSFPRSLLAIGNLREQGENVHSKLRSSTTDWLPLYFSAVIENFSDDLCKNIRFANEHYARLVSYREDFAGRTCMEIMLGSDGISDSSKLRILLILHHQVPWLFYVKNADNEYPLHCAARKKCSLEVLQFLLKVDPTVILLVGEGGSTPLHHLLDMDYIESEHLDKFQALFSAAGTTALLTTDHNGNTPLALSCQQNAPETALALLRASPAAAAMKNRDGNFPIQSFSECFKHNHDSHLLRTAFESLLVAYKGAAAEPNSEDVYLLHRVGQFGILDLVKLVYEMYPEAAKYCSGDKGTPLHQAALGCSVEIVEYLYSLYPEAANMTTEYSGASLLHFAARNNPEVLNAVYRYNPGATIRQATLDDGYLPLHELMGNYRSPLGMKPRMEMLRFLLQKYPAAAGVLDNRRRTPYHLLPQISDTKEALRLLLRAAPEVNPPELRRLNYEARRGALYLFFVAELPKSRVRVVTHSSIATPVDLRRSARQRGRNIQPTVALEPCHRARRVPNQLLGSRKLWRLLKGRGDRMLLKEIISFL